MTELPPITTRPLWVFGYGSLIWNPGFEVAETRPARVRGWQRSFCMRSIHHRGTEDDPGLVLALDAVEGAVCDGVAFRVKDGAEAETVQYLRDRELISSAYLEREIAAEIEGEADATVLVYVIDPDHVQYCGGISLEEQANIIAHAVGGRGPNDEYLANTAAHLHELDIADAELDWLVARVAQIKA